MNKAYGNKLTMCLSRHKHHSKFEAQYCDRLLSLKQHNKIRDYQPQVKWPLIVNGVKICDHIVDFVVWEEEGNSPGVVHETKGYRTPVWRIKYALFKALFPETKYLIIQNEERGRTCKRKMKLPTKIRRALVLQRQQKNQKV